jgi:hypothetical protein
MSISCHGSGANTDQQDQYQTSKHQHIFAAKLLLFQQFTDFVIILTVRRKSFISWQVFIFMFLSAQKNAATAISFLLFREWKRSGMRMLR